MPRPTRREQLLTVANILSRTRKLIHEENCPLAITEQGVTNVYLGISVGSRFLGMGVHISAALSHQAGYFSLRLSLVCYRIVPENSPAFSFVKEITSFDGTFNPMIREMAAQGLLDLFQARKASPHDRLSNGMTLLHYICSKIPRMSERWRSQIQSLILRLLQHFSAEIQESDNNGYTCADHLLDDGRSMNHTGWTLLAAKLLEHGSQLSFQIHYENYTDFFLFWALNEYQTFPDPVICSTEGIEMVLLRSEEGLRKVIERDCVDGFMVSDANLALFILATNKGWENGCRILL
ncbi:uncharacterized protein K460DRAFT_163621 [Cucurbitaria berberidis CBS 394.84]|uniref:Uncharacterized protein n=1 Tax=Cucurbitaria berberidis CBS 394.84 TaxID=1168544 RepID=A0A9P4L7K5_9PLEO|nr:uncharacterized protein K460DRAFT_163621 [Cucurbitaria berberidis CBS 394.84]KAF1844399.1 hypothetical protein K460DRAFT_163621 [Cucurbitaria berberidis CBS 394.84]